MPSLMKTRTTTQIARGCTMFKLTIQGKYFLITSKFDTAKEAYEYLDKVRSSREEKLSYEIIDQRKQV